MTRWWTQTEWEAEAERRAQLEAGGTCPDSGEAIAWCWLSELCDCAYSAPSACPGCHVVVWDLAAHVARMHVQGPL